jgi:urease accessory protein
LEAAIDASLVRNEVEIAGWILDGLQELIVPGEGAVLAWQHRFWTEQNLAEMRRLNAWFLASRETAELRQETE